jgi:sec-independent protein translocase protein TatB
MGLENIGGWELIVIVLVGLFIFGPDKLPKAISDGIRMLRTVRNMARNATGDLSRELGTTVELEDLNPKTFLRKHLLSEEDEAALRKPLQDIYSDARGVVDSVKLDDAKDDELSQPTPKPAITRSYDDVT